MSDAEPTLLVQLLSDKAKAPERGSSGAAGYDLSSAHDVVIPARGRGLCPTGLSVGLPPGVYGRISSRSGLSLKKGIEVGAGTVDEDFTGEVGVVLYNHTDEDFSVKTGDRVAQLILQKIAIARVKVVSALTATVRGSNGFGSTGV
jgi:dUTP pyrophosphatase